MTLEAFLERARACPVVPVLSVETVEQAGPLAVALARGGITVAEMTLRTPAGLAAIAAMKQAAPELLVGAGTVLGAADVGACVDGGADFLVSPGTSPALLSAMAAAPVPSLPGVATPSEAMAARALGLTHLKLFPAAVVGGIDMLKGMAGPLADLSFMPTGGVKPENMADYLDLPNVYGVGGTWIAKPDHVAAGDWAGIEERSREAASIARAARP